MVRGLRSPKRGRRTGQALVVAVTIMFILLAVGLLFLRNALFHLSSTEISNERTADLNHARAGIDFANHELMTSPLGADWRPQPRNLNPGGLAGYPGDHALSALDPDFQYLRPWAPTDSAPQLTLVYKGQNIMRSLAGPSGGFMRINFGQGRALLRVTYNPRNAYSFSGQPINLPYALDLPANATLAQRGQWMQYGPTPLSLYIRIDSIGRFGNTTAIDNTGYADPTLMVNAGLDRPYRVQMLAYKAFGLGDHLLFLTNKEKEGGLFDIGYNTNPTLFNETPGAMAGDLGGQELAGNLFINGSANWLNVDSYMNLAPNIILGEGVDIAGQTAPANGLKINAAGIPDSSALPTLFTSGAVELVRDNTWFTNSTASQARSIRRLQSPPLDLDRYRTLTQNSGGSGLWISNNADMQPPLASGVHDPQSLGLAPQSWFNPYNPPSQDEKGYWSSGGGSPGYSYSPPGVHLVFKHPDANDANPLHQKYYYISIGQTDGTHLVDAYYTPDAIQAIGVAPPAGVTLITDHTIMAEGNLVVHGDVAPGMTNTWWSNGLTESAQLAVVSRGTIYLDGSLTRAEDGTGSVQDIQNYSLKTLMVPSAVALLAQDHIALNLTQVGVRVQPWDPTVPESAQPDVDRPVDEPDLVAPAGSLPPASHWTFDPNNPNPSRRYARLQFSVDGVAPGVPMRIYFRHASDQINTPNQPDQDTEVHAYLNPPATPYNDTNPDAGWLAAEIHKNGYTSFPTPYDQVQGGITPLVPNSGGQRKGLWEYSSYVLPAGQNNTDPGVVHYGQPNVVYLFVRGHSYYLSRVEVKPAVANSVVTSLNLDGAFLANQGSFYVIPKDWFYYDPPTQMAVRRLGDDDMPQQPATPVSSPVDYSSNWTGTWQPGTLPVYGWSYDSTYPGYVPTSASDPSPQTNQSSPPPPPAPELARVLLDGSLTLNTMAPVADQAAWAAYDPAPVSVPDGTTAPGPLYSYNDGLVDIAFREGNWLPIMPRLPMIPGLIYQGEAPSF